MIATIAIVAGVGALMFLAIRKLVRDKKAGISSCGGSCSGCSGCSHAQHGCDDEPNHMNIQP